MPASVRKFKDYTLIYVAVVLILFGFIQFASTYQTGTLISLFYLALAVLGLVTVFYIFAKE